MKRLSVLFPYLKRHKFSLLASLVFAIIFDFALVILPLINAKMIDEITSLIGTANSLNDTQFFLYLIYSIILILALLVFNFAFETTVNTVVEKINVELRNAVFEKLNKVSIKYIDSHNHGDLVSRCVTDTENVNNALISAFRQFFQGVVVLLATLIIMFIYNWLLAIVVVILIPFGFLISYFVAKNSSKNFKKQAKINGVLSGNALETFKNLDLINSLNYGDKAFENYSKINDELYVVGQRAQFVSSFTNPTTRLVNNSTYAIVGVVAAILCVLSSGSDNVLLGASCTVGTILAFIQYSNQFAKPFNEISSCITEIQTGLSSLDRISEILAEENDIDEGSILIQENPKIIEFCKVFFEYEEKKPIINDFNLKIKQGQKVSLVGPTGCGKTTMINLLLRFYDPQNGSIRFDDTSLVAVKKSSIRKSFGMVLQDTWIFNGTVFDNIAYGKKDATIEEVESIAKEVNIYNFIQRLPNGFDTKISDKSGLSIGEKQLICIARVALMKPEMMILDEATSNIDTRNELKIASAFNRIMKGKTSIIIAHRLSTIKNSDLIVVMDKGSIVEVGNHKELLEKNGFYAKLYNAQYSN
ncbi:MAG: ABC transporter ATP-binding protein [Bacilli bacterium]|nr:ABC transporter ATP-binding protein [Bacilli bacterium]